jgi:hypothetical protein
VTIPVEVVKGKIYLIRGQKVLRDSDLDELYGVETKVRALFDAIRQMMRPEEKGKKSIGFKVEEDGAAYV